MTERNEPLTEAALIESLREISGDMAQMGGVLVMPSDIQSRIDTAMQYDPRSQGPNRHQRRRAAKLNRRRDSRRSASRTRGQPQ